MVGENTLGQKSHRLNLLFHESVVISRGGKGCDAQTHQSTCALQDVHAQTEIKTRVAGCRWLGVALGTTVKS